MRKSRLEWTNLPKDRPSANVTCFIHGKKWPLSVVTLDRKGKLEIGDGLITGNLRSVRQRERIPIKIKWSPDGLGRVTHGLNAPIDTTQLRLRPPSALQVVQECVASKAGVCAGGRIEWISERKNKTAS